MNLKVGRTNNQKISEQSKERKWVLKNQHLIDKIIKNKHRVGILYLLAKHEVLAPYKLAYRLGVYPRSIMYHLDRLLEWKLVEVHSKDRRGYREKFRLNKKFPNWVELVLKKGIVTHGQNTLEKITSRNEEKR